MTRVFLSCLICLLTSPVVASEQYPWKGEFSLGFLLNEGNTESSSVKAGFAANQEREKVRLGIDFKSLAEQTDSENTAEKYRLESKIDYKFSEFNYAFLYASYDDDRFTSFEYQASVATGYGRRLLTTEIYQWDVEIGPGYRVSDIEDTEDDNGEIIEGETEEESIVRLATKFDWNIGESTSFLEDLNVEAAEENTFAQSENCFESHAQ